MDSLRLDFTTNASGAASKTTGSIFGRIYGFALVLGTATAADVTITNAESITLYTKAGLNASAMHLPRKQIVDTAGAAVTTLYEPQPVCGSLTVAIANGGDAKTVSVILYLVP